MWNQAGTALRMVLLLTVLTGLVYPALVTGVARLAFPRQAAGSLMVREGRVVGSELIGQAFTRPEYFQGRPSAAGSGYDAALSGGSNLGPTSRKLIERTGADIAAFRKNNPAHAGALPADAVAASGSGLDPHISPAFAEAQAARVAARRGVAAGQVLALVRQLSEDRGLGFLGEPRVNVLKLNLELDRRYPARR